MADAFNGQGKLEQDEADRLQATAEQVGSAALSATTLAAAQAAIRSVQEKLTASAAGEAVADLRKIRTDPKLMAALGEDLRIGQLATAILIMDSIWLGYRMALTARARQMGNERLAITVDLNDADREMMREYPVLGHTAREIAATLITRLSYEVDGALALPLTGAIDAETIPAQVAAVGQAHGQRVGAAVSEAFFAGVSAAVRELGQALVGR